MKKLSAITLILIIVLLSCTQVQAQSPAGLYSATFTLTDAQTKALPTTGVEILPAQGVNTITFPVAFWLREDWRADYANIDGDASIHININGVDFGILDNSSNLGVVFLLAGGGPDGVNGYIPALNSINYPGASHTVGITAMYDSDVANQPITIRAFNGSSGNFTGGDPDNTLTVTIIYEVISY